ncbi:MAG: hypothetical protein QGG39_12225 [Candidatus Poribacteria bacterium]|nr:hypothetical protein [Candidatus Poribacteria bacterium]
MSDNNLAGKITVGLGQMTSRSVGVSGNSSHLKIRSAVRITYADGKTKGSTSSAIRLPEVINSILTHIETHRGRT